MAGVAFTDYSGLGDLGRGKVRSRTKFFVHTPAFLDKSSLVLDRGFMWNGALVDVSLNFFQKDRGWETTFDVNLSDFMREPSSGFSEYLLNQSLDVLALHSASPFQAVIQGAQDELSFESNENYATGAIIEIEDIDQSLQMGMLLYTFEDTLLKALSWYRRGISAADPVLGFLAIWISLETVAAKFHEPNEETIGKSKKQIFQLLTKHLQKSGFQFFKPDTDELWNWIEASYKQRNDLVHGLRALNPSSNELLRQEIPHLKSIVTAILRVMLDLRCKENEMIVEVVSQAEQRKKQQAEIDGRIQKSKTAIGEQLPR